ncbi:MAG: secondary thiamine-phosphate synthase enzyme YjbQ, partial [Elusimicrobia bacterium]|nr:secondary thiamine-phosphate synthase enzyme YjbQ [Elusimicrobiota bacterium]
MTFEKIKISTSSRTDIIDITAKVKLVLNSAGVTEGICKVFVPHTTAAVTINENADPAVIKDITMILNEKVPWNHSGYRHGEGNSAAHIKSSLMGASTDIIVSGGSLQLGTWQSVFFCDFDGPRSRSEWIK